MNNTTEDTLPTPPKNIITGIGARLRNAREAMRWSEKDAAARLLLSTKFITLMENEDFSNGPPATFIRGYLRSYGRLLNLPDQEINEAIEKLGMNMPTTIAPSPLLHPPVTPKNERLIRWITYLIVAILIVLVGIWSSSHSTKKVPPVDTQALTTTPASTQQTTTTITAAPTPLQTAPSTVTPPAPTPVAPQPTPMTSTPIPATPPTPSASPTTQPNPPAATTPAPPLTTKPSEKLKMAAPEPDLDVSDDGNTEIQD